MGMVERPTSDVARVDGDLVITADCTTITTATINTAEHTRTCPAN